MIIAKTGKPVAKLVPLGREKRQPGRLKGKVRIGTDFDAPLPESRRKAFNGMDEDGNPESARRTGP